jgi:hypothetical protein
MGPPAGCRFGCGASPGHYNGNGHGGIQVTRAQPEQRHGWAGRHAPARLQVGSSESARAGTGLSPVEPDGGSLLLHPD